MRYVLLSLCSLLVALAAVAQRSSVPFAAVVNEANLRTHLEVLAHDSMEGRGTGEPGGQRAARYLERELRALGLKPLFGQSYTQPFSLYATSATGLLVETAKGYTFKPGQDLAPVGNLPDSLEGRLSVVFRIVRAGTLPEADKAWSKAIVLFIDTARASTYQEVIQAIGPFRQRAQEAGAVAMLYARPAYTGEGLLINRLWQRAQHGNLEFERPTQNLPTLLLSREAMARLMGINHVPAFIPKGQTKLKPLRFILSSKTQQLETQNVGGYLPGKSHPGQGVMLTAHYDHLGIRDGKVYNGADDDGSGTAAGLAMAIAAVAAARQGHELERSMAFLFFTGEESGLLGSDYYTTHPALPLDSTTADINTDMIGRQDKLYAEKGSHDYCYVIGADKISAQLAEAVEKVNRHCCNLALDYKYNDEADPNRFYYRSDHYNFARFGVPVAFFFSGVHEDYHQPTDDIEHILWPDYAARARLIYLLADELATRPGLLNRKP